MSSNAKATHIFFSKTFQHICVSLDLNFNESLTNDIVSFEQLGPEIYRGLLAFCCLETTQVLLYFHFPEPVWWFAGLHYYMTMYCRLHNYIVTVCVVMLALWSPSSIAAHFAFCFTSCIVMLAFWSPSTAVHFAFCFTSCD